MLAANLVLPAEEVLEHQLLALLQGVNDVDALSPVQPRRLQYPKILVLEPFPVIAALLAGELPSEVALRHHEVANRRRMHLAREGLHEIDPDVVGHLDGQANLGDLDD